jgi:hypothetical protein
MNGREPRQESATAPRSPESVAYEPGEQMALLPEVEQPPQLPRRGTLAHRLLLIFINGARLTHPEFQERTGSWRLAAVVFELGLLGWKVHAVLIPAPTDANQNRSIARYWLAPRHVRLAQEVLA